jgi:hypothetical protein
MMKGQSLNGGLDGRLRDVGTITEFGLPSLIILCQQDVTGFYSAIYKLKPPVQMNHAKLYVNKKSHIDNELTDGNRRPFVM